MKISKKFKLHKVAEYSQYIKKYLFTRNKAFGVMVKVSKENHSSFYVPNEMFKSNEDLQFEELEDSGMVSVLSSSVDYAPPLGAEPVSTGDFALARKATIRSFMKFTIDVDDLKKLAQAMGTKKVTLHFGEDGINPIAVTSSDSPNALGIINIE